MKKKGGNCLIRSDRQGILGSEMQGAEQCNSVSSHLIKREENTQKFG